MKALSTIIIITLFSFKSHASCPEIEKPALEFINGYISKPLQTDEYQWLSDSKLVTKDFIYSYKNMREQGFERDPELGLGYNPIVIAQDTPDRYQTKLCSAIESSVTVSGVGMPHFETVIFLKKLNGTWLVNGAGHVNVK